jgi:signal transduction histidine kinase
MSRGAFGLGGRQWAGLALAVIAISIGHYGTSLHAIVLHEVFTRLYYPPIVFAALWGGAGAGLATALLASALYLPHVLVGWHAWPAVQVGQYAEVAVFLLIGAVAGRIGTKLRRERDRARSAGLQLEEALDRLQASLDERLRIDRDVTVGRIATGMAHEIRNPLGAARGALDILESRVISPQCRTEFAEIAREAIARASLVLDDLLEFARPRPPAVQRTDLGDLVSRTARLVATALAERGVRLELAPLPGSPVVVAVDAAQLQRALVTVLLEGPAALGARRIGLGVGTQAGQAAITIDMLDSSRPGPVGTLFEPFSDARVGHGLALALARRLVENQGGSVHVDGSAGGVRIVLSLAGTRPPAVIRSGLEAAGLAPAAGGSLSAGGASAG